MQDHKLNVLKGAGNKPFALTYRSKMASGVSANAGMCVHLDSDGLYALGVGNTVKVPLFLWQNDDDYDVSQGNNAGDPATDQEVYIGIGPEGDMTSFVGLGAVELFSTEYTGSDSGFVPNAPLTSAASGGTAGLIGVGTYKTNTIIGWVSRGIITLQKKKGVAFWADFNPSHS